MARLTQQQQDAISTFGVKLGSGDTPATIALIEKLAALQARVEQLEVFVRNGSAPVAKRSRSK
ncbi:MAG TPA: hypothetical protein VGC79_08325 [Polyangiaceae bacterium]